MEIFRNNNAKAPRTVITPKAKEQSKQPKRLAGRMANVLFQDVKGEHVEIIADCFRKLGYKV